MDRITAAGFHELVQVEQPRVSPDGERVAFVRKDPDDQESYEATIHLVATGGGEPRRFTIEEGTDGQPRFSPSGDRLAFVSTRGEGDRPQLWVVPTDGGEGRRVTDVVGGVGSIAWRPDSEAIAFTQQATAEDHETERDLELPEEYEPESPDPRVIDRTVYRSAQRYFDGVRGHVYVADLEGGVRRLTDGDRDYAAPEWCDAERLYYTVSVGGDPDDSLEYEIVEHDAGYADDAVLEVAATHDCDYAVTNDGPLKERLLDRAVPVIGLRGRNELDVTRP